MKLAARSFLCLLFLPLLASPAAATTFQMVEDSTLTDQARAIVRARVVDIEPSTLGDRPATDYLVEVDRVLKGDVPGSTLVVRVPGGVRPDGVGLKIWGAPVMPRFGSALLFLQPADDGTFRVLHLMLGAFQRRSVEGRSLAVRDLSEAQEVSSEGIGPARDAVRDFDRFANWIADRASGIVRERDYLVGGPSGIRSAVDAFSQMRGEDGNPIRWFDFDNGGSIQWRVHSGGQPGLGIDGTIATFQVAMNAWTNDRGSNIRYSYAGTTTAGAGFDRSDDVNTILFEDPGDAGSPGSFECGSGGVIAVGGPWFYESTRPFQGKAYHEAAEADIITNDGTSCFFEGNPRVAEEVFAHELGHTLGLGHSSTRDALMYARAHDDNRGARLHADDLAAVAEIYPSGSSNPPPAGPKAPTELAAKSVASTSVVLTWKDNSTDETGFRLERKVGSGKFNEVQALAAGVVEGTVNGLTAGTSYSFRVRAVNASGFSTYTNVVTVRTPAVSTLAAPTGLTALARSGTEMFLTWSDRSNGETGFRIERSAAGGSFQEVGAAAANSTGVLVGGLTAGTAYTFRVRAAGAGSSFSPYSGVAAATTPVSAEPACAASGPAVCLNGDRFQVEVHWRTADGNTGRGTLVRRSTQSATVWFFQPSNVELIVKVLDGRALNNAFWVFSSALSDVEYWIKVTDRESGRVRVWHNRQGQVRGLADTQAFVQTATDGPSALTAVRELGGTAVAPAVAEETGAAGGCATGASSLCLADRFRVEVRWRNPGTGASGTGSVIPDSSNTGFVWFFDQENIEMVVKVLDGRGLNGKFWLFYGALSDLESWVRVTDTQTGKVREYHNAPGSLATLADTSAF